MKKLLLLLTIILAGCSTDYSELPYAEYINDTNPEVTIDFEGYGDITLQLFPEVAPNTVNNFLELAGDDYYSEIIMHRIIKDFMIQGGDPDGTGGGGAGHTISGEFTENGHANNLLHYRGVISMARSQAFNSASSQFFIVHEDSLFLDGNYAGFGGMISGFDVLDEIANVATTSDRPDEAVTIKSVKVNMNGYEPVETSIVKEMSVEFFLPGEYRNETNPVVSIMFANDQEIQIELFPEVAPDSVENFLNLIEDEFYLNNSIHTVLKDFLIQGGDPNGDGTGGSDTTIMGEFKENGFDNSLSHVRGVIAMYRENDPNSASSQFFIVQMDSVRLDGYFAAFGAILTGFETLDAIANVEVSDTGRPIEEIVIVSITRIR